MYDKGKAQWYNDNKKCLKCKLFYKKTILASLSSQCCGKQQQQQQKDEWMRRL